MRISITRAAVLIVILIFNGCKKEDTTPTPLTLTSLMSGTTSLTSGMVTNVSALLNITATFSTSIDYTSIDSTSISLTHLVNGQANRVSLQYIVAGNQVTIIPATIAGLLSGANLVLTITNQVKSKQGVSFAGQIFPFQTAGIGIDTPPVETLSAQTLYLQFNGTVVDVTGNATTSFAQLSYTADRFGVVNAAGNFGATASTAAVGSGDIVEITGNFLISPSMTISVWLDLARINYLHGNRGILGFAADRGYYVEIGGDSTLPTPGPRIIREVTDHRVDSNAYRTSVATYTGNDVVSDTVVFASTKSPTLLLEDGWHHVVMTYDSSSHLKTFYVDGAMIEQWLVKYAKGPIALNSTNVSQVFVLEPILAIGYYCSRGNTASGAFSYQTASNTFVGAIDDMRLFNIALTKDQVSALYLAEVPVQ